MGNAKFGQLRMNPLRHDCGACACRIRQQQHELLAAKTGHEVGRAMNGSTQHSCNGFQALVAGDMAVVVVVRFEMIDIDHQDAERSVISRVALTFHQQHFIKVTSVCDSQQTILPTEREQAAVRVFEFQLEPLCGGDVLGERQPPINAPIRALQRDSVDQETCLVEKPLGLSLDRYTTYVRGA